MKHANNRQSSFWIIVMGLMLATAIPSTALAQGRGRGQSEGHHSIIFHNDSFAKIHDGQDAIAWIARQKWCNGKIGSHGGSANGIVQNLTAPGAPT